MDCNLSQLLITLGRADRTADDRAALETHLRACFACSAFAQQQSAFDSAIATAMQNVPVPETLHAGLLKAAYARRGAQWRKAVYRYTGMAAAAFLTFGLISGAIWQLRPTLDSQELVANAEHDWEVRQEAVRNWLTRQQLPAAFPLELDFDFRYYSFHGQGELAGQNLPVVIFQNGPEQLRLFIVREGQFNTAELQGAEGSVWKVAVVRHPTIRSVTYLALYTNALEPFLRQQRIPAF